MAKGKYKCWLSPDGLLQLEAWARDGLTDEQIAQNMDIVPSTLYEWKKRYPEISESVKRGKAVIDIQVENALLKRALGYEYKELKEKYELGVCTEKTLITKQVVPDTTAQIFWLKNRKVKEWGGQPASQLPPSDRDNVDPSDIRDTLLSVIDMVVNGDIDVKRANAIITAGNAVLSAIRTDEYEKKIIELTQLLERIMEDKKR